MVQLFFFEAGVVILIPLAFGLARKTKKSTLYYVIPLLAGLATGFAFIPPSAGSVLVANMLNVDLGVMIAVGVPVGILSLIFAGILWSKFIGSRINTGLPFNIQEVKQEDEANLPAFSTVLCIILVPLILILCNTLSTYIPGIDAIRPVLEFFGTPFVALIIAVLSAMYFLGKKQNYDAAKMESGAIDHMAIDVKDIEKVYEMINQAGLNTTNDIVHFLPFWENGVKFFTIEGPNKEKVEFSQYL